MKIAHCLRFDFNILPYHARRVPAFYPEEEKIFTLPELKAIVQEMEKMEKANANT